MRTGRSVLLVVDEATGAESNSPLRRCTMGIHVRRAFKMIGSTLQEPGIGDSDRTPATPIRKGRGMPGGMVAVFVLIGFLVVALALFT